MSAELLDIATKIGLAAKRCGPHRVPDRERDRLPRRRHQSRGGVHGLTTAAGIWVAAAIGLAVGAGRYKEAAVTAVALLAILRMLKPLERRLLADRKTFVLRVDSNEGMTELSKVLGDAGTSRRACISSGTVASGPSRSSARRRATSRRR